MAGADVVLRSASGRVLVPLDYATVSTFEVTRGSFTIPAAMLAEDADPVELARLFARALPDRDPSNVLVTTHRVQRDGSALVTWRRIVTHMRRA